jgi:hypothetical protein
VCDLIDKAGGAVSVMCRSRDADEVENGDGSVEDAKTKDEAAGAENEGILTIQDQSRPKSAVPRF